LRQHHPDHLRPATADWGTITYLAVEDALTSGNMLWPGAPRTITSGHAAHHHQRASRCRFPSASCGCGSPDKAIKPAMSCPRATRFENDLLKLIFNATAIANLADNAASSPLTSLYFALHTADPGEAGSQTTSECTYTSYARVAVSRNSLRLHRDRQQRLAGQRRRLPDRDRRQRTATHFSIGTASSGTGKILYSGSLSPTIAISNTVPPIVTKNTTITED
jgi:hypothetical protein